MHLPKHARTNVHAQTNGQGENIMPPVRSIEQSKTSKKLSYRPVTARCVLSVVILPITTQQCRNYLYDKSWPNRRYEVGVKKFEVSSVSRCRKITRGVKFLNGSADLHHTPFQRRFFFGRVGLAMASQCTKNEVSRFTRYEAMNGSAKCRKWGDLVWLGGTQNHGQCHHSIERIRLPIRL